MKIGITIPYASVNYSGGINVQCRMWRDGLESIGHQVDLLNPWDNFDYNSYDYLMIIGCGRLLYDYVSLFKQFDRPKLVSAPILDPNTMPLWLYKLLSKSYGSIRLKLRTIYHDYYKCRSDFAFFFVRSEFEKKYIIEWLSIPESRVKIVPISMRLQETPVFDLLKKEDVCLHVSRLASPGKNVKRQIVAAKKYGYKLRLIGTLHGEKEKKWLDELIGESHNIEYLGWLDEQELIEEYRKAKVLALPSIIEGVGMVALEAAAYGAEICLTNLGGPKEYYEGRAVLVNPYDIDSIGKGVLEAMNKKNAQPELSEYIMEKYSVESCMRQMERYLFDGLKLYK